MLSRVLNLSPSRRQVDALRVEPRSRVYLFVKTNDCKIASVSCIYVSYFIFWGQRFIVHIVYSIFLPDSCSISIYCSYGKTCYDSYDYISLYIVVMKGPAMTAVVSQAMT